MEAKKTILIIEDEPHIVLGLKDALEFEGFRVVTASAGKEGVALCRQERPNAVLLDLMLPDVNGYQVCVEIRGFNAVVPIIMLTARGQESDKIRGLEAGADDYVTKPFSLEELLARIKAVLRRTDPGRSVGQQFVFGDWQIDVAALKAVCPQRQIEISPREAQIIQFFAANPNRVIGREELYEKVWHDQMTDLGTRTVDVHIAKLRGKIEQDPADPRIITTVRGAGYRYEC